jgi:hypothetical protein
MLVPLAGLEPATCCSGDGSPQTLCSAANLLVGGDREAEVILSPLTGLLDELAQGKADAGGSDRLGDGDGGTPTAGCARLVSFRDRRSRDRHSNRLMGADHLPPPRFLQVLDALTAQLGEKRPGGFGGGADMPTGESLPRPARIGSSSSRSWVYCTSGSCSTSLRPVAALRRRPARRPVLVGCRRACARAG